MKTYPSESDTKPKEWDTTSSKISVYHNYNIEQVKRQDDLESEPRTAYVYDVDEYTKEEYQMYLTEKNRADIDYIMIMTDIE